MADTDGDRTLHSADETKEVSGEAANASPRAHAREDTAHNPSPAPHSAATHSDGVVGWVREWISPPEIWTHGSPPLKQDWAYARHGAWTTKTGLPRQLGKTYFGVVILLASAFRYAEWIIKRPSRHAAAWLLLTILDQFPPFSWILNQFPPFTWIS